jgi:hypothetical protein
LEGFSVLKAADQVLIKKLIKDGPSGCGMWGSVNFFVTVDFFLIIFFVIYLAGADTTTTSTATKRKACNFNFRFIFFIILMHNLIYFYIEKKCSEISCEKKYSCKKN